MSLRRSSKHCLSESSKSVKQSELQLADIDGVGGRDGLRLYESTRGGEESNDTEDFRRGRNCNRNYI